MWFRLPKHSVQYQVKISTFDENAKIPENKLVYTVSMQEKRETLRGWLVNIKRTDVLLNDTIDQDPFTEILFITAKIFSDLDLEVSNTGDILKVRNWKEIQEHWKEIRFKIDHTYTGDIVEPVMQQMDEIVGNDDLFLKSIQKDLFFFYYFFIYGNYDNHRKLLREDIPLYGFLGNKPVKVDAQLSHTKEGNEGIEIKVKLALKKKEETTLQSQLLKKQEDGLFETEMAGHYKILQDQLHIERMDFLLKADWNGQPIKKMQLTMKTIK